MRWVHPPAPRTFDQAAAPDYFEPIVGWRSWTVVRSGRHFRLRSIAFTDVWPVREPFLARCYESISRFPFRRWRWQQRHLPVIVDCNCGVHAARDARAAAAYLHLYDDVPQRSICHRAFGRVALWGAVVEGDGGWRASQAYPRELFLPDVGSTAPVEDIASGLAVYGVRVEILRTCDRVSLLECSGSHSERTATSPARALSGFSRPSRTSSWLRSAPTSTRCSVP